MNKRSGASTRSADTNASIMVVLDRSGSMLPCQAAVIEGFNAFLAEQAQLPGARVSLVQFDTREIDYQYVDQPIEQAPQLSEESYQPWGGSPLYDAIGHSIVELERHEPQGKVVFAIITDGEEGGSRRYTRRAIFDLIAEKRRAGWEFFFMGADIDAHVTGADLGVVSQAIYNYDAKPDATRQAFTVLSNATSAYRSGATASISAY